MFESHYRGRSQPEDVFTSNVFGLLRLLPASYLIKLLNSANWHGPCEHQINTQQASIDLFEYWPTFPGFGIPEILLRISENGVDHNILIEIKHGAPFGHHQIDRYWKGLCDRYQNGVNRLLTITHDRSLPNEVIEAVGRLQNCCIGWLSWYDVYGWLRIINSELQTPTEYKIIEELDRYIAHEGYKSFVSWGRLCEPINAVYYKRNFVYFACEIKLKRKYKRYYFNDFYSPEIHDFYSRN